MIGQTRITHLVVFIRVVLSYVPAVTLVKITNDPVTGNTARAVLGLCGSEPPHGVVISRQHIVLGLEKPMSVHII
jgi:hypothetical protein